MRRPIKHFLMTLPVVLLALFLISGAVWAEGEIPPAEVPAPETEAPVNESPALPEIKAPAVNPAPENADSPQTPAEEGAITDGGYAAAGNDPWFTVGLTTYRFFNASGVCAASYPGDPNCHDGQGADVIQDALDYIHSNTLLPTDRKLYVEAGTYNSFYLDASYPIWQQMKGVVGSGAWQTTLNGNVNISRALNGFLLQGFKINGCVNITESTGLLSLQDLNIASSGYGLITYHDGAILLNEVNISDSGSFGAYVDNEFYTGGVFPVTVTNSSFNLNGLIQTYPVYGLLVSTKGPVTISGVTANGNQGDGIAVEGFSSLNVKYADLHNNGDLFNAWDVGYALKAQTGLPAPVTLEHVYANSNQGGIRILTNGSLTASYMEASYNSAPTNDTDGLLFISTGAARIEYAEFSGNDASGLVVNTKSNVLLNSVRADGNGLRGADIVTSYWDSGLGRFTGAGTVTVTSPAAGGVLQANSFSDNSGAGLAIEANRSVIVNNADLSGNSGMGLLIDTCGYDAGMCRRTGNVSVGVTIPNWINGAYLNADIGIYIQSAGSVSLSATGSVQNAGTGIDITAFGPVKLTGVSAEMNSSPGAEIENNGALTPKSVILTDCAFNYNLGTGLYVKSKSAVIASGLAASNNTSNGVIINNTYGSAGISILPSKKTYDTVFNNNGYYGLNLASNGPVAVNGISAVHNVMDGLRVDVDYASAAITIQNTRTDGFVSIFNANANSGLYVHTRGAITLKNVSASNNYINGADLNNCLFDAGLNACVGSGSITINASSGVMNEFHGNDNYGIIIQSRGSIKLVNVGVSDSAEDGARLRNDFPNSSAGVIVTTSGGARNWFNQNNIDNNSIAAGLYVTSHGSITLSKVDAYFNLYNAIGVYLSNVNAASPASIIASDLYLDNNGAAGLEVEGSGAITITGITSKLNDGSGAYLSNQDGAGKITVTSNLLRPVNLFTDNVSFGLWIGNTAGAVYLQDVRGLGNGSAGVMVDNSAGEGAVMVKSTYSTSRFNNNGLTGLNVVTRGAVSLLGGKYGIQADHNGWASLTADGIRIDNTSAAIGRAVTLQNVAASNNSFRGILVYTHGPVTLTSIHADENKVGIEAEISGGSAAIRMLGTNIANGNLWWGMVASAFGSISITDLTAENNGKDGLAASTFGSGAITTVNSSYFRHNAYNGLYLTGFGSFALNSVRCINNGFSGNRDGLYIEAFSSGSSVAIRYSAFQDNTGSGIDIMHPSFPAWMPTLISSYWFGNDNDKSGDPNLYVHN